jgi:hypothetical protein
MKRVLGIRYWVLGVGLLVALLVGIVLAVGAGCVMVTVGLVKLLALLVLAL